LHSSEAFPLGRFSIGIDGYNLAMPNGTGVATYAFALARTLRQAGHQTQGVFGIEVGKDPAIREVMFFDQLARAEPKNKPRREIRREMTRLVLSSIAPLQKRSMLEVPLTEQVEKSTFEHRFPAFHRLASSGRLFQIAHQYFGYYRRFLRVRMQNPPQIMHWTYPVPLEMEGTRNIYTLHDLVPLRLPYTTLDAKASYYEIVKQCVSRAAHICTVSNASLADILTRFDLDTARITNTYQASPMPADALHADPAEDAAMVEGIFGLRPNSYFLYFGAIEPKKNVGRLLEAYLSGRTETPLVIVGARAWQSDDELRLLSGGDSAASLYGRNISQRIVRLDYLPRVLLLRLIRSAKAVVFPSLYEGFGLPVLEAMQLGTPVLTSRTSSLPEVAGDAAMLVDPYSTNSISEGLAALDGDAALRARLKAAGQIQAARFSQDRYLERLERMYEQTLASPKYGAR
jgi:glycosyltransferase involved in cell wall biosynthesis